MWNLYEKEANFQYIIVRQTNGIKYAKYAFCIMFPKLFKPKIFYDHKAFISEKAGIKEKLHSHFCSQFLTLSSFLEILTKRLLLHS